MVDLPRRHPNWLGSICGSNVERSHWPTIDSKTFARQGSNEIGLRSVWMERGRGILGTGITSATFHIGGKYPSLIEELKIAASG